MCAECKTLTHTYIPYILMYEASMLKVVNNLPKESIIDKCKCYVCVCKVSKKPDNPKAKKMFDKKKKPKNI